MDHNNKKIREIEKWLKEKSLYFERKELYRQLFLFYKVIGDEKKSIHFKKLIEK